VINVAEIDSPALLIYKERVKENIRLAKEVAGNVNILRPHVKTNKIPQVCQMMMEAGINKFKCATIAEADMLGSIGAKDVLIAYPLVSPKVNRFIGLIQTYPNTVFSCLIDNEFSAAYLSECAIGNKLSVPVYIDLNIGMDRTGIHSDKALELFSRVKYLQGITIKGVHAYDGHIRDVDIVKRQAKSDEAFEGIRSLCERLDFTAEIIVGGSPTFPTHVKREGVECSPGTFVFWDHGYKINIPDQPFDYAALVLSRIISITDDHTICTDLGYKSVSSENPLPRVYFLNATDATPISHSEEHLVLKVKDSSVFRPGDVLYGVPVHICPTVALYEKASVIENNKAVDEWKVVARDRKINI
jgi:D-serine deaminase-like pyridoxal phosphate-dependent protein